MMSLNSLIKGDTAMTLFSTHPSWAPVFVRLALGIILVAHGSQKLFGLWGGGGWEVTIQNFGGMGIPPALAILAIITEFFGGIALIVGFLTRVAALGAIFLMIVAIFKVHLPNGFFINWACLPDKGHGMELNIAIIGLAIALVIWGAGSVSVDHAIGGEKGG
jgi:putative oxidoreductase